MSWSRNDFIEITNSEIAKQLFAEEEIAAYVKGWSDDNKAALLHANNITAQSTLADAAPKLKLVAAFARKDLTSIEYFLNHEKVSAGVRLDYFLPLYDESYRAGEDIFVASTKALLNGDVQSDIHMSTGRMIHKVGTTAGQDYTDDELRGIEGYVNNSNLIRAALKAAPNKTVIQPNPLAVDYVIRNAATYRDTNNNPVIVFIPGAISIKDHDVPELIDRAIANGANINDVGFFGVPGIIWSIILADVHAVRKFLELNARLDIKDEMHNATVLPWVASTKAAALDDAGICDRLSLIKQDIIEKLLALHGRKKPFFAGRVRSAVEGEKIENGNQLAIC